MDLKHLPSLDWPEDLFRGQAIDDLLDDEDNPFFEPSDFAAGTGHFRHFDLIRSASRAATM